MSSFEESIEVTREWFASERFDNITRLYTERQVAEQQGSIPQSYPVARDAAQAFYDRLRALFDSRKSITTFGPYSPGQAVAIKRAGIEGIYLGGWATSAKGSKHEDPGADLASYPLSQVPDEAAPLVRALLAADRNQAFALARMTPAQREQHVSIDFRPFIIADADTGHGGDGHVRNLVRRFVEVGVPGYHIEDQKPGAKKCGHQGGKVLVSVDEQIKRLNAARFQLDIMGVSGIIVARTDAESASFIESNADERDHPFVLGATNLSVPTYKAGYLAISRQFYRKGVEGIRGHLLFSMSDEEYDQADAWLAANGIIEVIDQAVADHKKNPGAHVEPTFDPAVSRYLDVWQNAAGLKTFGEAVADVMNFHVQDGTTYTMTPKEWLHYASTASHFAAKAKARSMGISILWNAELPRTPEGYYPIRSGMRYGIAKSLAVSPFADILWMETKTANLEDARLFAEAIHAVYPDQMLAYNLSPSFNWDTTQMDDAQMRQFPIELGKLGYVFNFITYGGHQIDGLAGEDFAAALNEDGMLALARLQRKFRLVESPYKTPQTLVGGPRLDGALMASSGRTASTKAMGKGSTQFQHLIQTEVPTTLLERWIQMWLEHYALESKLSVELRPHTAGSELLELRILNAAKEKVANVIFTPIKDRRGHTILSVRDQNTFDSMLRKKRLMSLVHLFMIHRYDAVAVHYVSPTEDNRYQTQKMKTHGLFAEVHDEIGEIIVATIDIARIGSLLDEDSVAIKALITKADKHAKSSDDAVA
jgi:isocitrate lyase